MIRLTVKHLDAFVAKMEKKIGINIKAIDSVITHQTSRYGNEYFLKNFKLNRKDVIETLPFYGNCISASIPLGLELLLNNGYDLTQKNILLLGSGAGLSIGAMVLNFE